jgi:hypothetical protein
MGMIRLGLFLLVLMAMCAFGNFIWYLMSPEEFEFKKKSILGIASLPYWQEVILAYTAVPGFLAALLITIGRLRCLSVPADARGKGLAVFALLFTFFGIASGALLLVNLFEFHSQIGLPQSVFKVALAVYFGTAIMADVCTILFAGQVGHAVRQPGVINRIGLLAAVVFLVPVAAGIAEVFYPYVGPLGATLRRGVGALSAEYPGDESVYRLLVGAVIVLGYAVLVVLRYAATLGASRKAIRKYLANG